MFVDEKAIEFFTNEMILVKIHAEEDTAVSNRYHAKAFPTSLLINKEGDEVDRLLGFAPPEEYIQTFVDFSNGIGTLEDLLGRAETEADRSLYLEIADKYKYRGVTADAETWFGKVIEAGEPLDSLSGEARTALAYMLAKDEKFDEAAAAFEKVTEEFGQSYHGRDAILWLAWVHRKANDTTRAIAAYENFVELYPDHEDAEYAKEKIETLKNPPVESGE